MHRFTIPNPMDLIDVLPMGLALCQMDGTLVYVNAAFANIIGYTPQASIKLSYWELTPKKYEPQEFDILNSIKTTKRYGPYEKEYIHREGHLIPVRLNGEVVIINDEPHIWSSVEMIADIRKAENALRHSEFNLRQAQAIAHIGSWTFSPPQHISWSDEMYHIFGVDKETFTLNPESFLQCIHPSDRRMVQLWISSGFSSQTSPVVEFKSIWPDGSTHYILAHGDVITDADTHKPHLSGTCQDVTARKKADEDMQLAQFAMEHAPINITFVDEHARICYANKTACDTLGYSKEEMLEKSIPDIDPLFPMEIWNQHWEELKSNKSVPVETQHQRKNGECFPIEVVANYIEFGDRALNVAFDFDISERKRSEETIRNLAYHDYLTGLPNRALFYDRLRQHLALAARTEKMMAVLVLDLDHFKPLNDKLGHQMGDKALIEISKRLEKNIRASDTVARMGGDEFAIILVDIQAEALAAKLAAKLIAEVQKPILLQGEPHTLGVSIGILLINPEDNDMESIVSKADHAMYQAKGKGRNCYHIAA